MSEKISFETLLYEWWLSINNPYALPIQEPQRQFFENLIAAKNTIAINCPLESEITLKGLASKLSPLASKYPEELPLKHKALNWNT